MLNDEGWIEAIWFEFGLELPKLLSGCSSDFVLTALLPATLSYTWDCWLLLWHDEAGEWFEWSPSRYEKNSFYFVNIIC